MHHITFQTTVFDQMIAQSVRLLVVGLIAWKIHCLLIIGMVLDAPGMT